MSCASQAQEPGSDSSSQAIAADEVPVARVTRPARAQAQVATTLSRLVDAFVGSPSALGLRLRYTAVAVTDVPQTRFDADIGDDDALKGRYESRDDSFEVFDSSIHPTTPAAGDLGDAYATKIFMASFARLVSAGLIDPSRVRVADVVTRRVHASEGDQGGLRRTWIDEHAFFVPLTIDGIHVGTTEGEYGLHINIHRSGKLRRVALSGAAIAANEPGAVARARTVKRAQRAIPAEAVARAKIGAADIRPLGLRYLVNENAVQSEDLIARDLLWVSPTGVGASGEVLHGKAYIVSSAVNDAGDSVEISPPPGAFGPNPGDRVFTK